MALVKSEDSRIVRELLLLRGARADPVFGHVYLVKANKRGDGPNDGRRSGKRSVV